MGAFNPLGQHFTEQEAYNSKKPLSPTCVGQQIMELNSEQAKKDLLNLLLPPDQVNLEFNVNDDGAG